MSKPATPDQFSDRITSDRTWRMKEISGLKSAVPREEGNLQRVLLRALVAICYAHWEGYVKLSANRYLEYVARRNLSYKELSAQFLRNSFIPRLSALASARVSMSEKCVLVDEILNSDDRRFTRVSQDIINTKYNLNSEILFDICIVCGVDFSYFESHSTFIDVGLLKRRNAIAHGEEAHVDVSELDSVADGTIGLMRAFGDALENHVFMQKYLSH